MNEQIKQLALEADEYCRDYVPNWTMDNYNKKFAELIVRECAKQVKHLYRQGGGTYGESILVHFGFKP